MRRWIGLALFLSLLFHLSLGLLLWRLPDLAPPPQTRIEVEIVPTPDRSDRRSRQIVREALVPENMKVHESEDPLSFLSNQTQRVKKQTRAANLGLTRNHFSSGQRGGATRAPKTARPKAALDRDDLMAAAENAASGQSLPALEDPGLSTVGENLPESVQVGNFTALNTDRYLYYSFFSRVESLVRYRWESGVQNALDTTPKERLAANVRSRWITQMEILLNPKGEFVKVLVMKESGLPAFDQAAITAFAQARYFPNPPKEMVEDDGFIHLKYSFTVYYDPRIMARP